MQWDTKQHLGTTSEQTQLQNLPTARGIACRGDSTCPGHEQAKGVSETSGDLQSWVEPWDYPVPPSNVCKHPWLCAALLAGPKAHPVTSPSTGPGAGGPSPWSSRVTQEQSTYGWARGS